MNDSSVWICWAGAFLGVSTLISSLEFLSIRSECATGVYAARILSLRPAPRMLPVRTFPSALFEPRVFTWAVLLRLVASILLLLSVATGRANLCALVLIVVTTVFISYRNLLGSDGSDQMAMLIAVALSTALLFNGDRLIGTFCAWFIALQSALSYLVAGIAKATSRDWRSGRCVTQILKTTAYGNKWAACWLERRPRISALLCWCVILFELGFSIVLLARGDVILAFLTVGIAFHAFNAVMMGLNCFFWSFLAAYPAILHVTHFSVF